MKKTKFLAIYFMAVVCSLGLAACSNDDEGSDSDDITSDELPASTAAELPIPASVVDGVRMTNIGTEGGSTAASVTYNEDGSIDKAVYGGNEYTFEYEDTRAVSVTGSAKSTGRKLKYVRVKIVNQGDGYSQSYEDVVYNIKFNAQGFISSCDERVKETRKSITDSYIYRESEVIKLSSNMTYNADGRLSNISISTTVNYWDSDNGSDPVLNGRADVNYIYTDGNLTNVSMKGNDAEGTATINTVLSYTGAKENKYNITTLEMAGAMVPYSPIMAIMGMLGYLGNASATLPTKLVMTNTETDEDGTETDVTTNNISYTFLDDNKIDKVSVTGSDNYIYKYFWVK